MSVKSSILHVLTFVTIDNKYITEIVIWYIIDCPSTCSHEFCTIKRGGSWCKSYYNTIT